MSRVCVVDHSGYGHTKAQADAVADGARCVPDTEVHQIPVDQIDFHAFMDRTSQFSSQLGRRVAEAARRWQHHVE